jgi:eukaryotic-like serine/threonine-protein kinase
MKFELKKYNRNTMGGLLIHVGLAFIILTTLGLLFFYVYLPNTTNHGESITVPNIEGLSIEKAQDYLTSHDLRFEVNDSSYSSQYPPLTVLKQFPAPGSNVKENRKVYVSVNRLNPPTVPVPDLIDGSLINAEAVLKGTELKRGKIQLIRGPWLNVVQEMKIDGKTVVAGVKIPKGTVIDLVVMDGGSAFLPTPNVLDYSYEEAEFSIKGSNLNVGTVKLLMDTTGAHAVVVKQNPTPNENIKVGDVVDLWIGTSDSEVPEDEEEGGESDNDDQTNE